MIRTLVNHEGERSWTTTEGSSGYCLRFILAAWKRLKTIGTERKRARARGRSGSRFDRRYRATFALLNLAIFSAITCFRRRTPSFMASLIIFWQTRATSPPFWCIYATSSEVWKFHAEWDLSGDALKTRFSDEIPRSAKHQRIPDFFRNRAAYTWIFSFASLFTVEFVKWHADSKNGIQLRLWILDASLPLLRKNIYFSIALFLSLSLSRFVCTQPEN